MNKTEAQTSIKRIQTETAQLETSALVTLFELDLSIPLENQGLLVNDTDKIFYFHNNIKLITNDIKYQNNIYRLCPIEASGFELTSQGALPTPTLRITVSEAGIPFLALLKEKMRLLGDLTGCKIIRRRTFAKFLTLNNFNVNNEPSNLIIDELAELPKDVWFINRKSNENKLHIEYELNSSLDLENIQLPRRNMVAKRCNFNYRGEGCLYEYNQYRNDDIHGELTVLPTEAPPVATEEDKLITEILGLESITVVGAYQNNRVYEKGESVYIESNGIKYYFVSKRNGVISMPPNPVDWIADKCSKCIKGCKLRWSASNPTGAVIVGNSGLVKGNLPFGGFLALDRVNR